jgi:hypothetical protein
MVRLLSIAGLTVALLSCAISTGSGSASVGVNRELSVEAVVAPASSPRRK